MCLSGNIFDIQYALLHNAHSLIHSHMHLFTVVNCKRAHSHSLLQFLADLIPPYWQTLEFALSVAHRGQIPS